MAHNESKQQQQAPAAAKHNTKKNPTKLTL